MTLTTQAIKGASWLVLSRFLSRLIDFVTLIVLARILTPADFGLCALATTLTASIDMMMEVPIIQALLRKQNFDSEDLNTGFTLGFLRSLIFGVIILCAAWPFAYLYDDMRLAPLIMVLSIGPFMRGLGSPAMVHFVRRLSFRQTFTTEVAGKVIAIAAALAVVFSGGGYWAIATNSVVSVTATVIASYLLAPWRPVLTLSRFRDFSGFVGWFSFNQVLAALNWQLDRFLLGRYVDPGTFGRYTMASDLSIFPTQSVVGPAMQSIMAAFSSINSDRDRVRQAFLKAVRFVMLLSMPICIGLSLTSDLVVALVLGEKWMSAAPFLQLLSLAVLMYPYYQVLYSISLALDRPSLLFQITLIELVIRLVLIPLGLYLMSITGVLYARLGIGVVMFAVYMIYARRLTGIGIRAQMLNIVRIALAAALMAAAIVLIRRIIGPMNPAGAVELLACVVTGAAVYAGALVALGERLPLPSRRRI